MNRPQARGRAVFLDTSIIIARDLHKKSRRDRIEATLSSCHITAASPVVWTEFRRRVLKEAAFLLTVIKREGSYSEARRYVEEKLHGRWERKRTICFHLFSTYWDQADGEARADEAVLTERLKRYLRMLIIYGMDDFRGKVDHTVRGTGCYCGQQLIEERRRYERYDFGSERCAAHAGHCRIVRFLGERLELLQGMLNHLEALPGAKTKEIQRAEDFLKRVIEKPDDAPVLEPCKIVGDLLIALESEGIPEFFTLNRAESVVFCPVMEERLIVRPSNDDHEDEIYDYRKTDVEQQDHPEEPSALPRVDADLG